MVACTAVGTYTSSGLQQTLAEGWNGTSWAIEPTRNGPISFDSYLDGVSCTSASTCTAVGSTDSDQTIFPNAFVERWNGSGWVTQPTPHVAGSALEAVSCVSATACTATGSLSPNNFTQVPFAEAWNGKRWTAEQALNPGRGTDSPGLEGVSCVASAECTAVGAGGSLVMGVGLTALAESD
jgi:hypothetical protein